MTNEAFGWLWITVGLVAGAGLGLGFHRPHWLGGYGALPRRLLRLGHIALIALGFLNVLVGFSLPRAALAPWEQQLVSWAWIVGAVTMPLVCVLTAWRVRLRHLFVVPVASLIAGGVTLAIGMMRA